MKCHPGLGAALLLALPAAHAQEGPGDFAAWRMPANEVELTLYRNHGQNPRKGFRDLVITVCADETSGRAELWVQMNKKAEGDSVVLFEGTCVTVPLVDHVYLKRRPDPASEPTPMTGRYAIR